MKIDPLDKLFSQERRMTAISKVGGCERCLHPKFDIQKEDGSIFPAWKQLQCSHFWGRSNKKVRWDEDNAAGLCGGCHRYFTSHPHLHEEWFKERLGDGFDLLTVRANTTQKVDKFVIWLYLKERIRTLEESDG